VSSHPEGLSGAAEHVMRLLGIERPIVRRHAGNPVLAEDGVTA
jgi:hypothetical protein